MITDLLLHESPTESRLGECYRGHSFRLPGGGKDTRVADEESVKRSKGLSCNCDPLAAGLRMFNVIQDSVF